MVLTKVQERRSKAYMVQSELASKAGVTLRTLQRVEAGGSVSVTTAKGIARALHVKLEELI